MSFLGIVTDKDTADSLDGLVKSLAAIGSCLSAISGSYLGVDSVKEDTGPKFRAFWDWVPIFAIIPTGYVLMAASGIKVLKHSSINWAMGILEIMLVVLVVARIVLFIKESPLVNIRDKSSRRFAWIMLVLGFDFLFAGSFIDVIKYYASK